MNNNNNNNQASPTTTNCLSPFNIKRKCLSQLSTNHHLLSSPSYSISTINLTSNSATNSPSHLNDRLLLLLFLLNLYH